MDTAAVAREYRPQISVRTSRSGRNPGNADPAPKGKGEADQGTAVPGVALHTIRRELLVRRLSSLDRDVHLIVLVAPAGYGKTTLLRQWASEGDREFVWVDVGGTRGDAEHVVRRIATALHDLDLVVATTWQVFLTGDPVGPERLLTALVTGLREPTAPMGAVIVLDDPGDLGEGSAVEAVLLLASALPHGWRIALASRRLPSVSLRPRTEGRDVRLGADDLAFRPTEVVRLLAALGRVIPVRTAREVLRRTEGWPAGVYLAALRPATTTDDRSAAEVSGSDRHVADYFRDEVLADQPAAAVRFLLRTSPLDALSGELCDAALGTTGSAAQLERFDAENLFLVRQDRHKEWFRYHRMFSEMLLSELRRREPGEERRVRRAASRWFEQRRQPGQAIRYAISGEDVPQTERLILRHGCELIHHGHLTVLREGLDAIPLSRLEDDPRLALAGVWTYALLGDAQLSRRLLGAAEGMTAGSGNPALLADVARARAAIAPAGIAAMRRDVEFTIAGEPDDSPLCALSRVLLGVCSLLDGSTGTAKEAFDAAVRLDGRDQGPTSAFALAQRSLLAAHEGDWIEASACAFSSLEIVERCRVQGYVPSLVTYAACARVEAHVGAVDSARRHARRASRLSRRPSPTAFTWFSALSHVVLARVWRDVGDEAAAGVSDVEAERYLRLVDRPRASGTGSFGHATPFGHATGLEVVRAESGAAPAALTTSELRVLALLPTYLSLSEISEELFVSRNTVRNHVAAIYRKLGVANRADAVQRAVAFSLIRG